MEKFEPFRTEFAMETASKATRFNCPQKNKLVAAIIELQSQVRICEIIF